MGEDPDDEPDVEDPENEADASDSASDVSILREAARSGDTDAMMRLGYMYRDGDGVRENTEQARKWFKLAATHGDPAGSKEAADLPPPPKKTNGPNRRSNRRHKKRR